MIFSCIQQAIGVLSIHSQTLIVVKLFVFSGLQLLVMRDLAQKSTGLDIMHEFQKDSLWYLPPSLQIYTKLILYVSIYSQV